MITGRDNQTMQDPTKFVSDLRVTLNAPGGPLGIIRAQGADAVKFLQGQLTQDVALLGLSEARLAAWCSAKGRMLASFVLFKNSPEDIVLLCTASVLPATLKRLQMFVMRAKCTLSDASAEFEVIGQTGQSVDGLAVWAVQRQGEITTFRLPDGLHAGVCVPRIVTLKPLHEPQTLANDNDALAIWQYLNVSAGIAHITTPVADMYVPQMLNYESIGGVNFKKGCYPGQEVVARSQFRGTLKRRAFLASSRGPLAVGQEVFDSRDTEQPCGSVASAAHLPGSDQWHAILSMQTSAADSPRLSVGSADGATLQLQALPYALLDDI
jgi:tRNA-modifying protein YgfZ